MRAPRGHACFARTLSVSPSSMTFSDLRSRCTCCAHFRVSHYGLTHKSLSHDPVAVHGTCTASPTSSFWWM